MQRVAQIVLTSAIVVALVGCGSDEQQADAPIVAVPNTVLGDLVGRVACAEDVEVIIGGDGDVTDAVATLTLDVPSTSTGDALVISIPAVTTTIDAPGEPDPWVWLDPLRFAELSQAVGAALVSSGEFDPELIDRCLARLGAEMELLDAELFSLAQTLPDDARVIDVSAPGVLYFANRYEFFPDEGEQAVAAAEIMSFDDVGDAASYNDAMRTRVEAVVDLLGN